MGSAVKWPGSKYWPYSFPATIGYYYTPRMMPYLWRLAKMLIKPRLQRCNVCEGGCACTLWQLIVLLGGSSRMGDKKMLWVVLEVDYNTWIEFSLALSKWRRKVNNAAP